MDQKHERTQELFRAPKEVKHEGCDKYFQCPSCGEVSTQNAWDNNTQPLCTNRMERRKYVSIGIKGKGRKWYKCPKCDKANYNYNIREVSQDAYRDGITKRL